MYFCILFYPGRPDVQGLDWAISLPWKLDASQEGNSPEAIPAGRVARPRLVVAGWEGWLCTIRPPAVKLRLGLTPYPASWFSVKWNLSRRASRNLNCKSNCLGTIHAEPDDRFADQVELKDKRSLGKWREAEVELQGFSGRDRATFPRSEGLAEEVLIQHLARSVQQAAPEHYRSDLRTCRQPRGGAGIRDHGMSDQGDARSYFGR